MRWHGYTYVDLGWRHEYCGLFSLEYRGVVWYFLDNERYFRRGALYGQMDDGERFAFFSQGGGVGASHAGVAAGCDPLQRLADCTGADLLENCG